jgi:hypothetical protein
MYQREGVWIREEMWRKAEREERDTRGRGSGLVEV